MTLRLRYDREPVNVDEQRPIEEREPTEEQIDAAEATGDKFQTEITAADIQAAYEAGDEVRPISCLTLLMEN